MSMELGKSFRHFSRLHENLDAPLPHWTLQPGAPKLPPSCFQYSTCTGRRKALCIGINYADLPQRLNGCVNDAKQIRNFLIGHYKFKDEDIRLLTDDSDTSIKPTRQNILDAMVWLVKDAKMNDSLFFHYSGHGGQVPDMDGDEPDGLDEYISPLDIQTQDPIVDDFIYNIMIRPLPIGCRLTAVIDSCHSGTALDLPYVSSSVNGLEEIFTENSASRVPTSGDVIAWASCQDSQSAVDTYSDRLPMGPMTHAFVTSLENNSQQTYKELLTSLVEALVECSQKPQLSASYPIDMDLKFFI